MEIPCRPSSCSTPQRNTLGLDGAATPFSTDRLPQVRTIRESLRAANGTLWTDTRRSVVGALAGDLALRIGTSDPVAELIRRTAPLHDIGKIAIPDRILGKPGPLTPEEYDVMKTHTTIGATILAGGDNALIVTAERIALTHHERWDGSGYPRGLAGDAIPLEGRIVAVADFYDALTHDRPYRAALDPEVALTMIRRGAGRQFDSQVAEVMLELAREEAGTGCLIDRTIV